MLGDWDVKGVRVFGVCVFGGFRVFRVVWGFSVFGDLGFCLCSGFLSVFGDVIRVFRVLLWVFLGVWGFN